MPEQKYTHKLTRALKKNDMKISFSVNAHVHGSKKQKKIIKFTEAPRHMERRTRRRRKNKIFKKKREMEIPFHNSVSSVLASCSLAKKKAREGCSGSVAPLIYATKLDVRIPPRPKTGFYPSMFRQSSSRISPWHRRCGGCSKGEEGSGRSE